MRLTVAGCLRHRLTQSRRTAQVSFKYSFTLPVNGPNKLPRFSQWAAENVPGIEISLPTQVPVKSTSLTVRLKSTEDRDQLATRLEGVRI